MYSTIAFRPFSIRSLRGIEVGDPVRDGGRATESNINGVVRWKVANKALSIGELIVKRFGCNEAFGSAFESVGHVVCLTAISIC